MAAPSVDDLARSFERTFGRATSRLGPLRPTPRRSVASPPIWRRPPAERSTRPAARTLRPGSPCSLGRHTRPTSPHVPPYLAHEWLSAGGTEVDLMRIAGWRSREMLFRYGTSAAANARARDTHRGPLAPSATPLPAQPGPTPGSRGRADLAGVRRRATAMRCPLYRIRRQATDGSCSGDRWPLSLVYGQRTG
jgi:hypothetical protein